jgi:hypothetical protein
MSSTWNTPPCSAQRGPGPNPGNIVIQLLALLLHTDRATGAGAEPRQRRTRAERGSWAYTTRNEAGAEPRQQCPRRPRRPARRAQPAGPAAGGRRARAGRRADSSIAGDRHVRAPPRAERRRGSVPSRTGGRRHPGRAMRLGRPGLLAYSPLRAQAAPARHLAGAHVAIGQPDNITPGSHDRPASSAWSTAEIAT